MKLQANNIPSVVLLAFAAAAVVSWWPPTLFHHSVDAASGAFPTVKRGSMAEASSEDTPVGADIYTGPAIGSVAKVEWPELVNVNVDDAVVAIEQERPDLLMVNPTKEVRVHHLNTVSQCTCRAARLRKGTNRARSPETGNLNQRGRYGHIQLNCRAPSFLWTMLSGEFAYFSTLTHGRSLGRRELADGSNYSFRG